MNKRQTRFIICCRESDKYQKYIKRIILPISYFSDDLLEWLRKPRAGIGMYSPYALVIRNALNVGKNGRGAKTKQWGNIFPRVEEILSLVNKEGSIFAKMVMNESVAHRYADYYLQTIKPKTKKKYEKKMKKCYTYAYNLSLTTKHTKFMDSAMYWLAVAYQKGNEMHKAIPYYCMVANREGKRHRNKYHLSKINKAKKICKKSIKE